jgi:hypothetical protein
MRRESSTVVVIVGEAGDRSAASLADFPNVSVARAAPDRTAAAPQADAGAARPAWEWGAAAMRQAASRSSTYVIVLDDPLADVATAWSAMWDISADQDGPGRAAEFEQRAAEVLSAWRNKRFELPDYYLVLAPAQPTGQAPDLYLGPLRALRPHRVAVAPVADGPAAEAARLLDTLRSLPHGSWWPPLDELFDAARRFYPGSLAETRAAPAEQGSSA